MADWPEGAARTCGRRHQIGRRGLHSPATPHRPCRRNDRRRRMARWRSSDRAARPCSVKPRISPASTIVANVKGVSIAALTSNTANLRMTHPPCGGFSAPRHTCLRYQVSMDLHIAAVELVRARVVAVAQPDPVGVVGAGLTFILDVDLVSD